MMQPTNGTSSLVLTTMRHPARPNETVWIFQDVLTAWSHVRDHVLTAPECFAWAIINPNYAKLVDVDDADARYDYAAQSDASHGAMAQGLYAIYSAAIKENAEDARILGWFKERGDPRGAVTVAFGTDGVLIVMNPKTVITAFVPGQGDPSAVQMCHQSRFSRGLRRERRIRSQPTDRANTAVSERERRTRENREQRWSREERLYYRVFRPAVQFIRRCHFGERDFNGQESGRDYGLIKDVLPLRSHLRFEGWKSFRRQCGREVSHD